VPVVKRGDLGQPKALGDGRHGGTGDAKRKIKISLHEFGHAADVGALESGGLRAELFKRSLEVRLRAELADPASVFAGLPGVESWEASASGSYLLTVSDPDAAAPEVARALVHAGADILSITESRHSLEDVYLELVDEDVEAKRR